MVKTEYFKWLNCLAVIKSRQYSSLEKQKNEKRVDIALSNNHADVWFKLDFTLKLAFCFKSSNVTNLLGGKKSDVLHKEWNCLEQKNNEIEYTSLCFNLVLQKQYYLSCEVPLTLTRVIPTPKIFLEITNFILLECWTRVKKTRAWFV